MKNFGTKQKLFWAAMVIVPLLACVLALGKYPAGASVPLHFDFSGQVNGYGPVWVGYLLGAIMSAVNLLLLLFYRNSDEAYDAGMIHGVSRENAPKALIACSVLITVITVAIALIAW